MKKILNTRTLIIIIGILIVVIALSFFIPDKAKPSFNENKDIAINYGEGKLIKAYDIKKGLVYSNKIVVRNKTNKDLYYSVKWKKVKNTLIQQNKLLYKLDTHDPDALFIGDSQAPISDYTLSDKVLIRAKLTHTYEITIKYSGDPTKEKNSIFEGILEIVPNK